ncbi:amino acid transporter AVT1C [Cryptomeria japonica]|uniref:amino acid transporter AVT1C n=1 Tax=Cryptomeria japonica TaxID=3369 RepID=UPI0027DA9C97|nr:amino acid transporter AVT1C [Cryptomeria japonica]
MNTVESSKHHQFYIDSDEEDEHEEKLKEKGDDDSDSSDSSPDSPTQHITGSYNAAWPQSYRQSMDMYSSLTSPNIGFLGTPSLSRLSSSYLTSSFRRRNTPEVTQPLLPTIKADSNAEEAQLPPLQPKKRSFRRATHDHLPTTHKCAFGHALLNGMNVLCGVGILSTPYAIKEGGWLGLGILFAFALLSCYTGVLLRDCLESAPGLETYPDIGQAAFGTTGRIVVSIILYAELYASCVEYIILESDNLSSLFPNAHLDFAGFHLTSHQLFALITALSVLPTVWLRDLSILSYISAGGVIASFLVVICLFWVGTVDHVGIHHKGTLLNLTNFPIAIGLYGFCYSGHAVYPNIYTSMKNRSQFTLVLITSFVTCTTMYAAVAVMGYMMFGDATESQFTLNMPTNFVASKIAVWTTVVNPFTKYALTITPVALSLEELLPSTSMGLHWFSVIIRTALVVSTLVVALVVPFFGFVMALIGSLLTMLVALILPCVCFLSIVGHKVTWMQVILCTTIIIMGVACSAIGTYSSVAGIIHNLH